MQNYCKTIGALAAVSALVAGNAMAEVEYELHTGYTSEYLFRGMNAGQDLVEVGADVKTEVGGVGLSAGAWYGSIGKGPGGGFLLGDEGYNQTNLYGAVSKDLGFLTATVGYIYRNFGDSWYTNWVGLDDTQEVYFSVARQIAGVDTSLTYFWDIEGDNDGYAELAANKPWTLSPCLTLNTGADVGYLAEEGDFTALTLRASLDWGFANNAKLSPFVAYAISLSEGGRFYNGTLANYVGNDSMVVGGVMLSVGF